MKNNRRAIICAFIGLIGVLFTAIIVSGVMLKKTNNDVSVIENKEYSNLDYSFSLNDGSIYTKQDGVSFASGLVNTINIKFDYYTNYSDYQDYSIDTDVILYVKPGTDNEVNNSRYAAIKVKNIENNKNVELGMNQVNLEIDYQYYATQSLN